MSKPSKPIVKQEQPTIDAARAALEADRQRRTKIAVQELKEWADKHHAELVVPLAVEVDGRVTVQYAKLPIAVNIVE